MNTYVIVGIIWFTLGYMGVLVDSYIVGRYGQSDPSFRPGDLINWILGPIVLLIRIVDLVGHFAMSRRP
jgi:hypothetical protein